MIEEEPHNDKSHHFKPMNKLQTPYERREIMKRYSNSGLMPHGGAIQKPHNEERLNIQSDGITPQIETKESFHNREKSIDFSMKSNSVIGQTQDLFTQRLIDNNRLSKYLTGFIGKKDYRTSEERELDN